MIWSAEEIVRSYRMAADPKKQIKVLAELNACSVKEIRQVLVGEGVLPRETEVPEEPKKAARKRFDEAVARMLYEEGLDDAAIAKETGMTAHTVAKWRSRNGLRKKARKPRMKKQVDVPSTKPSEAEPDVQKIPIVGEAVEVTEPDFTKSAAPEPRTVTVEELRALLEDACKGGLGECAVLVEGTALEPEKKKGEFTMMNEASNACVPQKAPAILSVTEENAKIIEIASIRVEDILRKLRGEKPVRPNEGCASELPTFGALRQLTERQQRQLNRLMNSIEELDSLI